jgi:hypothetical protein
MGSEGPLRATKRMPIDASEMALDAQVDKSPNQVCYRCKEDVTLRHDKAYYCKAFSQPEHAGRWLLWDDIRRVLEKHVKPRAMSVRYGMQFDDPFDLEKSSLHRVVGVSVDGRHGSRFESPHTPEFSLLFHDPHLDKVPAYTDVHDPYHEFIYMGWRGQLRQFCEKFRLDFTRVALDLGVSPDRSGEETTRLQVGWV